MLDHTLKNADKTLTDAQDVIMQLQTACQALNDEASDTKTRIALLEHKNEALVDERSKQEQQIKESTEQLCNALNQISSLMNKLELIEGNLRKSEDLTRALSDEKLFLVQEKSELLGQLKVLQNG